MARLGRNEPCHCESGKKYKRCCGPTEEAAESAARRTMQDEEAARVKAAREADKQAARQLMASLRESSLDDEAFVEESNAIVALIHAGQLDDAEARARALIVSVPDATDGLERLGHVYEARGDMKTAARHYREAIALTQSLGLENEDHVLWLEELANRIDPPAGAALPDGPLS